MTGVVEERGRRAVLGRRGVAFAGEEARDATGRTCVATIS